MTGYIEVEKLKNKNGAELDPRFRELQINAYDYDEAVEGDKSKTWTSFQLFGRSGDPIGNEMVFTREQLQQIHKAVGDRLNELSDGAR